MTTATENLLHDVLRCRLVSSDACRVYAVLCLNDPAKIVRLGVLRSLCGIPKPGRCLRELEQANLIALVRDGYRGRNLSIRRLPAADFHLWKMAFNVGENPTLPDLEASIA